jgi:hypothetical protein
MGLIKIIHLNFGKSLTLPGWKFSVFLLFFNHFAAAFLPDKGLTLGCFGVVRQSN